MGLNLVFADDLQEGDCLYDDGDAIVIEKTETPAAGVVVVFGFDVHHRQASRTYQASEVVWRDRPED